MIPWHIISSPRIMNTCGSKTQGVPTLNPYPVCNGNELSGPWRPFCPASHPPKERLHHPVLGRGISMEPGLSVLGVVRVALLPNHLLDHLHSSPTGWGGKKCASSPGSEAPRRYHLHDGGRGEHLGDTSARTNRTRAKGEGQAGQPAVGSHQTLRIPVEFPNLHLPSPKNLKFTIHPAPQPPTLRILQGASPRIGILHLGRLLLLEVHHPRRHAGAALGCSHLAVGLGKPSIHMGGTLC